MKKDKTKQKAIKNAPQKQQKIDIQQKILCIEKSCCGVVSEK